MTNRLANETSPYLQQHAHNPVDWYPWGEDALKRAREEDRPILLSIGYSACHWCHVMAHESFEDPAVAEVMNRHFVSIKVDREERPDIDQIYQTAHQLLTGRGGGWPLTMFLASDQRPFFGGTYFPKQPRYNLPGFAGLCERIAQVYREQRAQIDAQSDEVVRALDQSIMVAAADAEKDLIPGEEAIVRALQELQAIFDRENGGLGTAPKFPHPTELELALSEGVLRDEPDIVRIATFTLEQMALGGIYDQLGGGFCRYSTDAHWSIPHFEKMLYDNGPLLRLYADAWLVTRNPLFEQVVRGTAQWVMREMQSPEGGYYSSLDADSEGEEGRFYVWQRDEVRALLPPEEYAVAELHYGLDGPPNFEGQAWHLRVARSIDEVADALVLDVADAQKRLQDARGRLFAARAQRVRPGRDEKILTSWNALMIHGMVHAARVFGEPSWLESARRALDFVQGSLWNGERLLATYKDGYAHLNAYLDDHAFLLAASLEMLQADFDRRSLVFAQRLADLLLARFEDAGSGGFFFTSHDHERLILRPKPGPDNATPSGNGVAAWALQRMGHLLGEPRHLDAAAGTLRAFTAQLREHPGAFASMLAALREWRMPPRTVVLTGPTGQMAAWRTRLSARYLPATMLLSSPDGEPLPGVLDKPRAQHVNAWICEGVTCLPPVEDVERVLGILAARP